MYSHTVGNLVPELLIDDIVGNLVPELLLVDF